MRTTILIFQPHRREPQLVEFAGAPSIREVEVVVGGPFEQIPEFLSIEHGGALHRCVAFAPRNRAGRPLNVAATIAWDGALRREMGFGLIRRDGARADQLAGSVVVVVRGRAHQR